MEKVIRTKQSDVISEVKSVELKSYATAKEHVNESFDENKKDNDSKETEKENELSQPKKCVSMKHGHETHGRNENKNENNNNCEEFSCDEEKEEDEECETHGRKEHRNENNNEHEEFSDDEEKE